MNMNKLLAKGQKCGAVDRKAVMLLVHILAPIC